MGDVEHYGYRLVADYNGIETESRWTSADDKRCATALAAQ